MDTRQIDRLRNDIYKQLDDRRINDAFASVMQFIDETNQHQLRDEVEQLKLSYTFMLQYLAKGILDPQREQVLQHIIDSLYSIADRCCIAAKATESPQVFYTRRRELEGTPLATIVGQWRDAVRKHQLLSSVPAEQQNKQAMLQVLKQSEQLETTLFNKVWSTFPTSHDDTQLLRELVDDDTTPEHVRCLVLSALFLGLVTLYDETKLVLLAQTYSTTSSVMVQVRALMYAILSLYLHSNRAIGSSQVKNSIETMTIQPSFAQDMATLQFLLARSRNTDNITRRVREDLMPGIMNMSPDLMRKIKDKDAPLDISDLEANPEWQEMLENSGIARKMEEFSEMQLQGNDVYISTFSRLKSFPFFHTLSNWFLPFHAGHSATIDTFGDSASKIDTLISHAPLCNSDKFSFTLSMGTIPQSQRQMMFDQVQQQHSDFKEMLSAELPRDDKQREAIANAHLQDLYRFFKLFSRRREFKEIFALDMDLTQLPMLHDYTHKQSTLSIIAEFYFKNEFHEDAIKYYTYLLDSSDKVQPIVFQKIGFCHQSMGNMREAIRFYKRYLLAQGDDVWTLKHIASCYRSAGRHDKALDYYKQVDALQQSVATTLSIGNCLLESGNAEEALQYYYKADFMDGANHRAWRPIAWCSFITGNDERALTYYDKIFAEDKPTATDYMNRGHVLLCNKRIPEAIDCYREALRLEKDASDFRDSFMGDAPQLQSRGISAQDMALIIDALQG